MTNRFNGYNRIMMTDSYNLSHTKLKINTDYEVSHMYNRKEYRNAGMILFGLQQIISELLDHKFTIEEVREAEFHAKRNNLSFPTEIWMRVINECSGYIPIRIQMLPEGTYVPVGTPFAQIRNTKKGFGELVTWFEGVLMHAWFPSSCATEAFHMRRHLQSKVDEFGEFILWKYHSFGFRGHASIQNAREAGSAWNLFLHGTDDFHTNQLTPNAKIGSIPALAHKVTQQFDNEYDCYTHAIDSVSKVENIVAEVIDTYNSDYFIDNFVVPITEYAKLKGVHVVFRPDSGMKHDGLEAWQDIAWQVIRIYHNVVGANLTNATCIVGEGMSFDNAMRLEKYLLEHGVPFNFCFNGIGAGFYKHLERDTHGWAMKTAFSNGQPRAKIVLSNPFKSSLAGVVSLSIENDKMIVRLEEELSASKFVNYRDVPSNIYINVYNFNSNMIIPYILYPDWNETQKRALKYVNVTNLQKNIKLSSNVVAQLDIIKEQHLKNGVI